jgi:ABC-type transport system involved in cytochrome bd biosynthesis fused ATPase/permease subunit
MLLILTISILLWLVLYGSRIFGIQVGIFTLAFYILMISSDYWVFYRFLLYPTLSCWEVTVLGFIVPVFLVFFKKNQAQQSNSPNGFLEDLPIVNPEDDSFNRMGVAKEIADKINITSNKRSFAIGILGEYGSGKTSFMNLIRANLDKNTISVIEFNPWGADGRSNIQQDFFDLLSSNLYRIDPKISGLILDYSRKLGRTGSSIEKFSGIP